MNYYNFNFLSGESVQVSQLSQSEREVYIYNRFRARARKIAKYYARAHAMSELECELFCASAMYNKAMDLRSKELKRTDGIHYNALEYVCMIRVFSQLKIAHERANYTPCGTYSAPQSFYMDDMEISFSNGPKYTIKGHETHYKSEIDGRVKASAIAPMWDYVELLEMWDNRHARHESNLMRALDNLDSLTSVWVYTSDKHYLTMTESERERAQNAINKQLHADAVRLNAISMMTQLNGTYNTPEVELEKNCALARVRARVRDMRKYEHFADVCAIIGTDSTMSETERQILSRFRKRYGLAKNLKREDLRELFANY